MLWDVIWIYVAHVSVQLQYILNMKTQVIAAQ
jgi:hypothetical protein